jgi:hypothetical protein
MINKVFFLLYWSCENEKSDMRRGERLDLRVSLGSHTYHHESFASILSIFTSLSTSKSLPIMDRNSDDEQILAYDHRTKVQGKYCVQHTNRFRNQNRSHHVRCEVK